MGRRIDRMAIVTYLLKRPASFQTPDGSMNWGEPIYRIFMSFTAGLPSLCLDLHDSD